MSLRSPSSALLSALVLAVLPHAARGQETSPSLDGLDAFVERVRAEWQVPGLAVAVVKDDQVLLAKGYGVRDLETSSPVTTKTLFAIGSISKSFTTTGLSILADEGKLDWDAPARDLLPEFRLADE